MAKQIINISDNYHPKLKDKLFSEHKVPRGTVGIYDKLQNGQLKLIERNNLIVFQGREWLLERAFGAELDGATDLQDRYLKWFGLGTGGGEIGNPLQAGSTNAWDTNLIEQLRMNPAGVPPDYAPKNIGGILIDGYYKKFTSVVRKEDPANAYILDNVTYYPNLIAEIRIEISSEDGNGTDGSGYADLNEAGLYIDNPNTGGSSSSSSVHSVPIYSVERLSPYTNDTKYIFELGTDITGVHSGDSITVTGCSESGNNIENALILDVSYESGSCMAFVTVENENGVTESTSPGTAYIQSAGGTDDIFMFSRVTFSTIRKTVDREIVFLWKIYF